VHMWQAHCSLYVCVYMYARTYVRTCGTCNCKRNKATLSWLRLVCCRHEVPVTSEPITVIHMDEDVVVVNKPASIPVSGVLPELYCQKNRLSFICLPGCIYASRCHARCRTPDHARTRVPLHERDLPSPSSPHGDPEPPRGGVESLDTCRIRLPWRFTSLGPPCLCVSYIRNRLTLLELSSPPSAPVYLVNLAAVLPRLAD